MTIGEELAHVRQLSDGDLLLGLTRLLQTSRAVVARVIAHLGEVEERRLHLLAGYGSLFAYCTSRLSMSEDEACRRIDVARLARRFPLLLDALASGHVSLSVAALLKPHLTPANHVDLLACVEGKTVQQTREVLASWFPQPDVVPSIRKLPARPSSGASAAREARHHEPRLAAPTLASQPRAPEPPRLPRTDAPPPPASPVLAVPAHSRSGSGDTTSRSIEPLSTGRFKVQFTADAELKRKLELARDLLRHAVPHGDLADIVARALDLLLEQLMKRRFGVKPKRKGDARAPAQPTCALDEAVPSAPPTASTPESPGESVGPTQVAVTPDDEARRAPPHSRHVPNDVRRAVLARDGARCTWRGPDGVRCNGRAWLELDHVTPFGCGGDHHPANLRLLCRSHNRLAAERAYGQHTINRCIASRRARPARAADDPR